MMIFSLDCFKRLRIIGKTTLASLVALRLNQRHTDEEPGCALQSIAAFVPMDGYHLSRAQLSAMPDPSTAHARRGAAFTFDDKAFLTLVEKLREPILPESTTIYAPSFDHATKDPVDNDIPIPTSARVIILEGNYMSLNNGLWKEAGGLMDELWFVDVDFETARRRLVGRHVRAGIAPTEEEAHKRVTENDLVNGREIVDCRLDVQEFITSIEDDSWKQDPQTEQ
ncbi:MAG: hypothetical protein LQ346_000097 [Caloplaca aetnensis]|nr:MAG: hypothetical protein LQ346_000097 [Caloplaca aetnensis]